MTTHDSRVRPSWFYVSPLETLIDVAFGNGMFVGVGLHGLRWRTRDGLRWSDR